MDRNDMEQMKESVAVIPKGMTITGNIETQDDLTIYGEVNGNVTSNAQLHIGGDVFGDVKAETLQAKDAYLEGNVSVQGVVSIHQNAVILGDVSADSAEVYGALQGTIDVKNNALIGETAIVDGDVKSKSIQINTGAVISGHYDQVYASVNAQEFFKEKAPDIVPSVSKKEGTTKKKKR